MFLNKEIIINIVIVIEKSLGKFIRLGGLWMDFIL
jgi:hypothetical protein